MASRRLRVRQDAEWKLLHGWITAKAPPHPNPLPRRSRGRGSAEHRLRLRQQGTHGCCGQVPPVPSLVVDEPVPGGVVGADAATTGRARQ